MYVLDDGSALKIEYTAFPVAKRIQQLQTGNPRPIAVVAVIEDASPEVERLLHRASAQWNIRGREWFARKPLQDQAKDGWPRLLGSVLPGGDWTISMPR